METPELPSGDAPEGFKYSEEGAIPGKLKYALLIGAIALLGGLVVLGLYLWDRFFRKYYALGVSVSWEPAQLESVQDAPMAMLYPTSVFQDTRALYRVKGKRSLELLREGRKQYLHAGQEGLYLSASSSGSLSHTIVDDDLLDDCNIAQGGANQDCNLIHLVDPPVGYSTPRYVAAGDADQDKAKTAGYLDNCTRLFDPEFEFAGAVRTIFGTPVNDSEADDFYVCLPGDFSPPQAKEILRAVSQPVNMYAVPENPEAKRWYLTEEGTLVKLDPDQDFAILPEVSLTWDTGGSYSEFSLGTDTGYLVGTGTAAGIVADDGDPGEEDKWRTAVNQLYYNTPYVIRWKDSYYLTQENGTIGKRTFPVIGEQNATSLTTWKFDCVVCPTKTEIAGRNPR